MKSMRVERTRTRLLHRGELARQEPSPLTPAELVGAVWELTVESYYLRGGFDAELRLPRHVVRLTRKRPAAGGEKDRSDSETPFVGEAGNPPQRPGA